MVGEKVKLSLGLHNSQPKSLSRLSPETTPSPSRTLGQIPQKGAAFSRSFGVSFPRASSQVQPETADLVHLLDDVHERESQLKEELLQQKLLREESPAILPLLEKDISRKNSRIERWLKNIECLEAENESLRQEVELLHSRLSKQKKEFNFILTTLTCEISDLKDALAERESDEISSLQRFQGLIDASGRSNLIRSLKKSATLPNFQLRNESSCKLNSKKDDLEPETLRYSRSSSSEETSGCVTIARSREPRVPEPPPKSSSSSSSSSSSYSYSSQSFPLPLSPSSFSYFRERKFILPQPSPSGSPAKAVPPPPPPPPPSKGLKPVPAKVRRVPELVELYHALMRRDSRREDGGMLAAEVPLTVNARDMIGEIENRSAHLLAIKTDVETQGDFIRLLIKEVEGAAFTDIENVVPFVKWLDAELSYLVDERAVLKHFEWPEQKADALREAAFGYSDLKKLESEASSFRDDPRQSCASALKKMQALFEKLEHGVYNLSRIRESASKRYQVFKIPIDWMLDNGYVSQIKLACVKLAMKYMKRASTELETVGGCPEEEELVVQGVRFAFRVHQFAGGFDVETIRAFQELRDKASSCHMASQNQQQQRTVSRSTSC